MFVLTPDLLKEPPSCFVFPKPLHPRLSSGGRHRHSSSRGAKHLATHGRAARKWCRKSLKMLNSRLENSIGSEAMQLQAPVWAARPAVRDSSLRAARAIFLAWIARNPLKSPESDEGIQGNPSPFSWSGLDWL